MRGWLGRGGLAWAALWMGAGACQTPPNDVPPGGCAGDAECPHAGCARGVCVAGTCQVEADDRRCRVQQHCDAQRCEMMGDSGACVDFVVVDPVDDDRCCPEGLTINEDSDCAVVYCGNDVLNAGEECDDGNTETEVCGYGVMECEVCDASCRLVAGEIAFCGDRDTDVPYEECDDGNTTPDDGCENDCTASTPDPIVRVDGPGFAGTTSFAAGRRNADVVIVYAAPTAQGDRLHLCQGLVSYSCSLLTSGAGPDHQVHDLRIDAAGNAHMLWHDGSSARYMVLDSTNAIASDVSTGVTGTSPGAVAPTGHALLSTDQALLVEDLDFADDLYFVDLALSQPTLLQAYDGADFDAPPFDPAISLNGGVVAYASAAGNAVAGDDNGVSDVFVQLSPASMGAIERVSVSDDEQQANGPSRRPSLSANGLFVAFETSADNLYPGDGNGLVDIALRNRMNGTTERISIATTSAEPDAACTDPAVSADGRFVVFRSAATTLGGNVLPTDNLFVRDRQSAQTILITIAHDATPADGPSSPPRITPDGELIIFTSAAGNLVPSDPDPLANVFVAYNPLAE